MHLVGDGLGARVDLVGHDTDKKHRQQQSDAVMDSRRSGYLDMRFIDWKSVKSKTLSKVYLCCY